MELRNKGRAEDFQLDLFGARAVSVETLEAIPLPRRETFAPVPSENGHGVATIHLPAVTIPRIGGGARYDPGLAALSFPDRKNGEAGADNGIHQPLSNPPETESEPLPPEPEARRNQNNYQITDADQIGQGSLKRKCQGNLEAIALLKQLEQEQRPATDDEKSILVRYVGWGGLPQVFDPDNELWANQREQLEA
jgi:hypothetical protein